MFFKKVRSTLHDSFSYVMPKNKRHFVNLLQFFVYIIVLIFIPYAIYQRVRATDVSGDITVNTTWNLAGSPYNMTNSVTIKSGAILTIDAGVQVKSNGNYYLIVETGTLDVNGTSENRVTFTHNSSTSLGAWQGIEVRASGVATIDYANIYYTTIGVRVTGGTLTINDTIFSTNIVGILVYEQGNLTTARNTINKSQFCPLNLNPDVKTISLGSGVDADILGSDTDKNGYNGICVGYLDTDTNNCPSDLCKFSSRTFAGISNIPYVMYNSYEIKGNGDEIEIDPNVIVKFAAGKTLTIKEGAFLDINGTSGNEVKFTSYKDDSIGGDTNNNGASTGAIQDWERLSIESGTNTIDYLKIYYANIGTIIRGGTTIATIQDSTYDHNRVGISVVAQGTLTTRRDTFTNNTYFGVNVNPDIKAVTFGSGVDADIYGSGNGYTALGVGYAGDTWTNDCVSDLCKFSSRTFAGISNIPYIIYNSYEIKGPGDEIEIDPNVIVKFAAGKTLTIKEGAFIDINGTSGNEVKFTSYKDDSIGGDTNNNGASTGDIPDWERVNIESGINTIDYLKVYYANIGTIIRDPQRTTTTATIQDSTYDHNRVGISVIDQGTLTTRRNTFTNNSYFGVNVNPERKSVTFGSGIDADIYGSGNGYTALGVGYAGDTYTENCPSDLCKFSSYTFAGISNIPYLIYNNFEVKGPGDELEIDPNVIIKFYTNISLTVKNGAILDINGSNTNPVYLTSVKNDNIYGDTNNDNYINLPALNDWGSLKIESTPVHAIDFLYLSYANRGLEVNGATNVTVNDSYFRFNNYGVYNSTTVSPVFTRVNMSDNVTNGMYNANSTVINAENLWWGESNGPYDASDAGQCSHNYGLGDIVRDEASYPIDYCPYTSTEYNSASVVTNITTDIGENSATGNGNVDSLDVFFDISKHGHIWNTDSNIRYLNTIAQWKMNDNAANTNVDENINNYDGTASQNTQNMSSSGKINTSLSFNGSSDQIITNALKPRLPFSISLWVYPYSTNIVGLFDSAPNQQNVIRNYTTNYVEWWNVTPRVAISLTANEWQYLVFVFKHDGVNRIIEYYKNGALVTSASAAGQKLFAWTTFTIGSINNNSNYYNGKIDDFRIVEGALTLGEIQLLYNSSSGTENSLYSQTDLGTKETTGSFASTLSPLEATTTYYTRSYIKLSDNTYIEGAIDSFITLAPGSAPFASASNLSGISSLYGGKMYNITSLYSDSDGASNLDKLYIKIQNPGGTSIEYYGIEGINANGLTPTNVSGSDYVTSITYDRSVNGNNITLTWHITIDWDWFENSDIEYGVRAIDDDLNDSGWSYTNNNYLYENDLNFTGTLSVIGSVNGNLNTGDWVKDSETINWSGIKVVYENTTDIYPIDSDFDIELADDDGDKWYDVNSSGELISITSTSDNSLDTEDIHNINIISIPSGGSDISNVTFSIKVDNTTPNIVDITGENEGVWQNNDGGPIISWTDPNSPSNDTFYLTNNGTDPSSSNYTYVTDTITYDLPNQGQGETIIKVKPKNGAEVYGITYSFIIRYDNIAPVNVSNLTAQAISTSSIKLDWNNPVDSDFDHCLIKRKTDSVPSNPNDGTTVYSGNNNTFTNNDLESNKKYYYTVFAYDTVGNYSSGASVSETTLPEGGTSTTTTTTTTTTSSSTYTTTTTQTSTNTSAISSSTTTSRQAVTSEEEEESLIEELTETGENIEEVEQEELPEDKSIIFVINYEEFKIQESASLHAFKNSQIEVKVPIELLVKDDKNIEISNVLLIIGDDVYVMKLDLNNEYYTASFVIPNIDGDYDVFIVVKYSDDTGKKINLKLSVDPYGYVYTKFRGNILRIKNAQVNLYKELEGKTVLWDTDTENYPNPQYTDNNGEYKYYVENGRYKIIVKSEGYQDKETDWFEVNDRIVELNIELKPKYNITYIIIISLILIMSTVTFIILYNRKRIKSDLDNKELIK